MRWKNHAKLRVKPVYVLPAVTEHVQYSALETAPSLNSTSQGVSPSVTLILSNGKDISGQTTDRPLH